MAVEGKHPQHGVDYIMEVARQRVQQRSPWIDGVTSNDFDARLKGTKRLLALLYKSKSVPCNVKDQVLKHGIIEKLDEFLEDHRFSSLQVAAAFSLAKLDSDHSPEFAPKLEHVFRNLVYKKSRLQILGRFGFLSDHRIPLLVAIKRLRSLLPKKVTANKMGQITNSDVLAQLWRIIHGSHDRDVKAKAASVFVKFISRAKILYHKYLIRHELLCNLAMLLLYDLLDEDDELEALNTFAFSFDTGTPEPFLVREVSCTLLSLCKKKDVKKDIDWFIRGFTNVVSSMYRLDPHCVPQHTGEHIVLFLCNLLKDVKKTTLVRRACWGLASISRSNLGIIKGVFMNKFEEEFCELLIPILKHKFVWIIVPALYIVTDILRSSICPKPQIFYDSVSISAILRILEMNSGDSTRAYNKARRGNPEVMVCYLIGSICRDGYNGVKRVIDSGAIQKLIELIPSQQMKIDCGSRGSCILEHMAAKTIELAISLGNHKQIMHLVDHDIVEDLCDLLVCNDKTIINSCLAGLGKILDVVTMQHSVTSRIKSCILNRSAQIPMSANKYIMSAKLRKLLSSEQKRGATLQKLMDIADKEIEIAISRRLVNQGIVEVLCVLLVCGNEEMITSCLKRLRNIFDVVDDSSDVASWIGRSLIELRH